MSPKHPREWEVDAACYREETAEVKRLLLSFGIKSMTELFYPPRIKSKYHVFANEAKKHCLGPNGRTPCPVRKQCLSWAIATEEEHGIWGGMSHRERNALVRKAARAVHVRVDDDNMGPAINAALEHIETLAG
jgi:hypothetical protein